jgi:hypothetical protein
MIPAFGYGAASVRDHHLTTTKTLLTCTPWSGWCADAMAVKFIDAYVAEAALATGLLPADIQEYARCESRARVSVFAKISLVPVSHNLSVVLTSQNLSHVFKYIASPYAVMVCEPAML